MTRENHLECENVRGDQRPSHLPVFYGQKMTEGKRPAPGAYPAFPDFLNLAL